MVHRTLLRPCIELTQARTRRPDAALLPLLAASSLIGSSSSSSPVLCSTLSQSSTAVVPETSSFPLIVTDIQAVRAAGAAAPETGAEGAEVAADSPPETRVAVDCLNFDRVLLFLESQHLGTAPPHFPAHQLDGVLAAARALGLRSLEQSCLDRMVGLLSGPTLLLFSVPQAPSPATTHL